MRGKNQPHNFAVYAVDSGTKYLEFELTRNQHLDNAATFTVSALFKMPPKHLAKDAWRILCDACTANALLPEIVNQNYSKALRAIGEYVPEDAEFVAASITTPTTTGQPVSDAGFATSQASSSKATGVPSLNFGTTANRRCHRGHWAQVRPWCQACLQRGLILDRRPSRHRGQLQSRTQALPCRSPLRPRRLPRLHSGRIFERCFLRHYSHHQSRTQVLPCPMRASPSHLA